MNELVQESVNVMWPVLGAGAAATAHGVAEEGGARLYAAVAAILAKIRHRLDDDGATRAELTDALRQALAAGEVDDAELRALTTLRRSSDVTIKHLNAEKVYFGSIHIDGGGSFNG